ncbi:MAG: ABC transporter ATP-binding protein [Cyanobacteria bacterium P01_D01_bin.123]
MKRKQQSLTSVLPSLWSILRHFWPYIRKQWSLLLVAAVATFVEIGARLLEPWPLKYIFDRVLVEELLVGANGEHRYHWLMLSALAIAVVAITGLRAISGYASRVAMALAATKIMTRVRGDIYSHLQRLSLTFHNKAKNGDLIARVTGDIERLREVTVIAMLPLVVNSLTLVGMLGVMLWLNWELALIAIAIFPLFALTTVRMTKRIRKVAQKQRQQEGAMAATAAESMSAIKVVQALSLHDMLESAFSKQNSKSLKEGAKAQKLAAGLERTVEILVAISTALVLWRGTILVIERSLTPGDLLVFISYLKTAFKPMRQLAKYTGQISKATASGERILDLLEISPEVSDRSTSSPAPAFRGHVWFDRVSFSYESGRRTLHDLNFVVGPGQTLALVGPSGGGKSTLTSLLLRLYDPASGRILIDDRDIRQFTLDSLRQQIGVVLQDSILFGVSIRANIAYGCLGATQAEVEAAATLANAHEFVIRLPDGYDTVLGEGGATLSGGQRQRIAIARAAIRRSPIVILDEPTTGLDNASKHVVSEALARLTRGRTTFLITHDLTASIAADRILYIENGRILERGTHAELMALEGHYARHYRLQTRDRSSASEAGRTSYAAV